MLQRILVATDFSPAGRRAVMRAGLLAKHMSLDLTLLHVVPDRSLIERAFGRRQGEHTAITKTAERTLQAELESVQHQHGIRPRSTVLEGAAHRVIGAATSAFKVDLLVLGATGEHESFIGSRSMGGTALKCFVKAHVPLLLVRQAVERSYCRVLAAVDATIMSQNVLAWALELSKETAGCEQLHVVEAPFAQRLRFNNVSEDAVDAYAAAERAKTEQELATITSRLRAADRIKTAVVRGEPVSTLLREINQRQPDLVVLGKRSHRGGMVEPHSFGSVGLRVCQESSSDVLVTP